MLLKSLTTVIANTKIGVFIRNNFGIKQVPIFLPKIKKNGYSVSDTFFWRTDNFYTIFKYTDILKLFYECSITKMEIFFYDDLGNLIKREKILTKGKNHEFIIDENYIGKKGFGTFCIFHDSSNLKSKIIIANRCYVGYSYKKNLPSFVHGNYFAKYKIFGKNKIRQSILQHSILNINSYCIQNNFSKFDKTELFFSNPNLNILKFSIGSKDYVIPKGNCLKVLINNEDFVKISKSNSLFIRPIVFNYIDDYIDVYHS